MESVAAISVISVIIAVALILFYVRRKAKEIQKLRADFEGIKDDILNAEKEFKNEENKDLYFSKRTLATWKTKWANLESGVKHFSDLPKNKRSKIISDCKVRKSFLLVNQIFQNGETIIKERNEKFIESECDKFKNLFDNLEKYPLIKNQRRAIITDEISNLVVAGAGTGKTSVIVGKVAYILQKGLAKPNEILLLAYGNKAMEEMTNRVNSLSFDSKIDVKTFHSLGLAIIAQSKGAKPSLTELRNNSNLRDFIKAVLGLDPQQSLDEFLEQGITLNRNRDFYEKLTRYFIYYLRPYRSAFEFSSKGEYINYIKENQIRSLNGELVRSYEECEIANFLYENGIKYQYEHDYEIDTATVEKRQYQPDFYLPDYGIYIEHFGINKKGKTAPFVDQDEYLQGMDWKRNIHEKHGTKLIETFSYEKADGILLTNLEKNLKEHGVVFQRIPKEEILEKINKMGVVIPFVRLVAKFLTLFKASTLNLNDLREKAKSYKDWERYEAFLDIFEAVYDSYELYLKETGKIDYNDMIKLAIRVLKNGKALLNYKYILVDEFQDISKSRYNLLKGITKQTPLSKLLCVGDDWQSIYRFTGSELAIMTNFKKNNEYCEQMYLDKTFRLNSNLCQASSTFILKNKNQISKNLIPRTVTDFPAISLVWTKIDEEKKILAECLAKINNDESNRTSVFILGRYKRLKPNGFNFLTKRFPKLEMMYSTVHSSKGKEADYVIVLGLESGKFGFPCKIEDDPVLNLVLTDKDDYLDAEERRLFYVALSRAKKHVYLLADPILPSPFVTELLRDCKELVVEAEGGVGVVYCPECKTGLIIKREKYGFFSCSNFPYCNYKPTVCPKCKAGFLKVSKEGNIYECSNGDCDLIAKPCPICENGFLFEKKGYNKFLGCSNFPTCKYTETFE